MANTFLAAQGKAVGKSLAEHDLANTARDILDKAKAQRCEVVLPVDAVVAQKFEALAPSHVVSVDAVGPDDMILDIGPRSVEHVISVLARVKTLVWNGPFGAFELEPFDNGTIEVAEAAAELTAALAERILNESLPSGVVLNVNVPAEWNGAVALARQGDKAGRTILVEGRDPRGAEFVWLHEESHEELPSVGELPTDIEVLRAGVAAVTPLQLDRTAYTAVRALGSWRDVLDGSRFLPKG